VQDLASRLEDALVDAVDVLVRLDRERDVVQAGRIELELLLLERLPQTERSRARRREPQVVDLLAALALDEERLAQPERTEDVRVERERPLEVSADEVDVPPAGDNGCWASQAVASARLWNTSRPDFEPPTYARWRTASSYVRPPGATIAIAFDGNRWSRPEIASLRPSYCSCVIVEVSSSERSTRMRIPARYWGRATMSSMSARMLRASTAPVSAMVRSCGSPPNSSE
jgi:hypothetical protein